MPILCFGGSFNPIHNGHLQCASAVAKRADFDQVLLIPNAQPPHKSDDSELATPRQRLEMAQLAAQAADPALFDVSDIEIRRSGPSYTLDTARELRKNGLDSVNWLIGADMLLYLPKWHKPLDLLKEVNFLIMARPGWTIDWQQLPPEFRHLKDHVVEAPLIDISASDIRRRVREGLAIDDLVPHPVANYINKHKLYRSPS